MSCLSICRPLFNQYIDTHFICPRCRKPLAPSPRQPSAAPRTRQSRPSANRKQSSFCLSSISISFDECFLCLCLSLSISSSFSGSRLFGFRLRLIRALPRPSPPPCQPSTLTHFHAVVPQYAPRDLHFRLTIVRGASLPACHSPSTFTAHT